MRLAAGLVASVLWAGWAATAAEPAACTTPRISISSLLDGVQTGSGILSIGKFYAQCLPDPVRQSSTNYGYNPYDGGKLSSTLKDSTGQTLFTYVWYGEKITTLWEFARYEVIGGGAAIKPVGAGSYVLEFAIEGRPFQRLPFSVSKVESGDIYHPEAVLLLDGPWRDYAELYFPKPDRYTQLFVWLRDVANSGPQPRVSQYSLRLVREKDGKLIAGGGGASSAMQLRPQWNGYKLSFAPLAVQRGESSEFPAAEILATDGAYRVELAIDGKPYASYRITVANGRFQRDPAEAREAASALLLLADEPNHWSLRRLR